MMKSGAPPAISRLLVSLAHAMAISRLALVGWLDLGLDLTGWAVFFACRQHPRFLQVDPDDLDRMLTLIPTARAI
jgi:hypothetical protein